jgi:hypothetical protein
VVAVVVCAAAPCLVAEGGRGIGGQGMMQWRLFSTSSMTVRLSSCFPSMSLVTMLRS